MIDEIRKILKDHWGYDQFRPLQEEIILSVLNKIDTLALLPTGGGKSICFQVPALYEEGLCLVITPLIALMKDQVENLKVRNIKAAAIFSGMSNREIERTFSHAAYGGLKFLYVSPERLETSRFESLASVLPVNLIAIDEAHCISQWGYDFRPSYLKIAEIRKLFKDVPFLALTATATNEVRDDIIEKLEFQNPNFFQKSFERQNLVYGVVFDEAKYNKLLEIVNRVKGCGIVYVRTRKQTKEISDFLRMNNVSCDYYHAGLDQEDRNKRQDDWKSGRTRIIAATNAFGMGIDKDNVRLVVHMQLPDSLEAYYQEAGRAGRDLRKSFAVAIINNLDKQELDKRMESSFPDKSYIQTIYHSLCNYYQIPLGSGASMEFDFDLSAFCSHYNLDLLKAYNAIKFLEKDEMLFITDKDFLPSRLFFSVNYHELYEFQLQNPALEAVIKTLLRSYEGLFDIYVRINENDVAKRLGITAEKVVDDLLLMNKMGVCHYVPSKSKPQLVFLCNRLPKTHIMNDTRLLMKRRNVFEKKITAIKKYAYDFSVCRSKTLLSYFGEHLKKECGHCDYCLNAGKSGLSNKEFQAILEKMKELVSVKSMGIDDLSNELGGFSKDRKIAAIKWMHEQGVLVINKDNIIELNL